MPQLQVDIDNDKAVSLGLSLSDVTDTLSSAWGGTYVNDFIDRGRVKKFTSRAKATPAPCRPISVNGSYGSNDSMTPFSAFATTHWQYGPESLVRYNGSAAFEIQGENASGFSSGAAMENGSAGQQPAGRHHLGVERHVAAGKAGQRAGHEPVCHLDSGGVPVSRRAV
jgi:multidrug efflux pump